jgi:pimeloyl-ACP methyl ester carboxylesterase
MHQFAQHVCDLLLNLDAGDQIPRQALVRRLLFNQLVRLPERDHERYIINTQHLLGHPALETMLPPDIHTLIVTGEYDTFTRPEYGWEIASALPHSTFTTIRNADHLFHLEQTSTALALIDAFFHDRRIEKVPGITPPRIH